MKINSIPQVFSSNLNKNLNIPSYLRVGTSGDSFERTKPEVISSETLCQTLKTKGMKAKDAKKLLNMLINANMRCIDVKIAHSITNIYEETKDIEDLFYIVSIGSNNEYVKKNERVKFFDTVGGTYSAYYDNNPFHPKYLTNDYKNIAKLAERQFLFLILQTKLPDKSTGNKFLLEIGLDQINDQEH